LLGYLWILIACLVIVVGLAVLAGFILRKINHRHDDR
jgi:ABC-type polysaccharide/polyol phosphate export permease